MKILIILLLFCSLFANDSMNLIEMKIQNIDKKRSGINKKIFNNIQDPFYKSLPSSTQKKSKIEEILKVKASTKKSSTKAKQPQKKRVVQKESGPLQLELIINKSALINKQWHHVGDDIEGYKIIAIQSDYVIVDQYGERSKLKIASLNSKIRLKTRKRE